MRGVDIFSILCDFCGHSGSQGLLLHTQGCYPHDIERR
jgi:hypothetical protein